MQKAKEIELLINKVNNDVSKGTKAKDEEIEELKR